MGAILQIEIGAQNIALSLREQVKRQTLCFTDLIDSPLGPLIVSQVTIANAWVRASVPDTRTVLIRDVFGSGGMPRSLAATKVQVVQAILVSVSTLGQLESAGNSTPDATETAEVHLIFDLQISAAANSVSLTLGLSNLEDAPTGIDTTKLQKGLAAAFPLTRLPIDVSKLSGLAGPVSIANADISAFISPAALGTTSQSHPMDTFNDDSFVAVRIEAGNFPVDTAAWEQFFSAPEGATFRAVGKKGIPFDGSFWSVFTDQSFIVDQIQSGIFDTLAGSSSFRLQGGVDTNWAPADSIPVVTADFYGALVNACDLGIIGKYDVGAHITASFQISVPDPPFIAVTAADPLPFQSGSLEFDVDFAKSVDASLCALESMLLWPYVGFNLMETGDVDIGEYLLGIAVPHLVVVGALLTAAAGGKAPTPDVPGSVCVRPDANSDRFVCTKSFDSSLFPLGGEARLEDFLGRDDGLLLLGDFNWNQRLSRLFHIANIDTQPFSARASTPSCSQINSGFPGAPSDSVALFYQATVDIDFEVDPLDPPHLVVSGSPSDLVPPHICNAFVRQEDDPQNVYWPFVSFDDSLSTITVRVPLGAVPGTFVAPNNYPCKLIVQTSAGARMIKLDPMQVISAADADTLRIKALADKISQCYAKQIPGGYNPRWGIDPADGYIETQLWRLLIGESASDPGVGLRDGAGAVVAQANPRQTGGAELHVIAHGEGYAQGLTFFRAPSGGASASVSVAQTPSSAAPGLLAIDMQQIQLLRVATLAVGPFEESFCLAPYGGRTGVIALRDGGLWLHDISSPNLARLRGFGLAPVGARGVIAAGRDCFVWGVHGLHVAHLDSSSARFEFERRSEISIRAIAYRGGRIYILREDRLEICDGNGSHDTSIEMPHARTLAAGGAHLLVGFEHSVDAYALDATTQSRKIGAIEFPAPKRLKAWNAFGRADDFFIQGAFGSKLVGIGPDGRVHPLGENTNLDQLSRISREGSVYVEHDPSIQSIHLYKVGKTLWS
jgi:hypothetical protein